MAKYRKKPVIVEAFKWTGGQAQTEDPEWMVKALKKSSGSIDSVRIINKGTEYEYLRMQITKPAKIISVLPGDYITMDEDGALNKCSPKEFEASYELVS